MSRSRSLFDLSGAIAAATALGPAEEVRRDYANVSLVSFDAEPPTSPSHAVPIMSAPALPAIDQGEPSRPAIPKLPDLSGVTSPGLRCERIVEWIADATSSEEVFIADEAGLLMAGAPSLPAERIAATGVVAQAVLTLARASESLSSLFELHVGEGPVLQLIGFQISQSLYLVGLSRSKPLSPRQAHAVRLACVHALGDVLGASS